MWSNYEIQIVQEAHNFVEEVYDYTRKGVPQMFYVIEVVQKDVMFWDDHENILVATSVPDNLLGLWKLKHSCDTSYWSVRNRIEDDVWVKVERVPVTTYEYKEVNS